MRRREPPFTLSLIPALRRRIVELRWWLMLVAITEITVAGAVHNRLRALQLDVRSIALTECPVAVAGEQMPDMLQPHLPIHLRVPTARDVEVEPLLVLMQ